MTDSRGFDTYDDEVNSGNRLVLVLFAVMVVFLASMIYVSATSITDGLEAYYKLDETTGLIATDFSGNGNNGTMEGYTFNHGVINGGVTIEDGAMVFDGTTGYVDTGISQEMLDNSFSLSAWVNKTNIGTSEVIISKNFHYPSLRISSTGKLILGYTQNSDIIYATSSNSIPIGEWVHITGTYNDSDNSLKVYINGVFEGSETTDGTFKVDTNHNFLIGKFRSNPLSYFNGSLDDVLIYDRALTSDEIEAQYEAGRGSYALSGDGLVAQYSGRDYNATHILDTNPVVEGANENTTHGKRFDGTNNYIEITRNSNLEPQDFTLSGWVYYNRTKNNDYTRIIDKTYSKGYLIDIQKTSNIFRLVLGGTPTTSTIINDKEWFHYSVIKDGENINLYINSQLKSTGSYIGNIPYDNQNLFISSSISDRGFDGSLDEVGIWSRALSEDEIQYLYESSPHAQTTFSSEQVSGTTDQNITLTCEAINGCKTINYNIDNNSWIELPNRFLLNSGEYFSSDVVSTMTWETPTFGLMKSFDLVEGENSINYANITCRGSGPDQYTGAKLKIIYEDDSYVESDILAWSGSSLIKKDFNIPEITNFIKTIEFWGTHSSTGTPKDCRDFNVRYEKYGFTNPFSYSFLYSGTGDHNIQYFSTDNSDNNESIKTSNFTTYGKGRFYFKDENTGSDLTGVQINFNGTDYDSGANNYLDFNFQTFPSTNTTYLFTLSKTGYSTRYYQTDLNYFSDFNTTFALLPESLATDLQFKMFPPTGTTTLANTYIEFKDKDTNYTITRLKSNSEGELTANLRSDDQNYLVWISEGTYIYQAVQLTILYPKDEQTLADITGNWRIEITDNISYQDLNIPQGTNKIIYLLPNTKYPFTIAVQDTAGTYFKRKWSKIYQGNPLTDTLQPYLVNADDGIAVKFVFQDPKRDSIENIIINIYKNVGGVKTLISSGASDVTGNALFFLIAGDKYWLEFTYDGIIIFETQNYTVTSSTVYWTINLATREIKTIDGKFITVGFNPIQDYILKNATNISYKVTASGLNRTRAEFYIIQDGNKIITYTRDAPCTTPCTVTIPIEDLNITLGNKVYLDLNVYIDSNNYIFNYKKTWSYGTTSNIDTHDLFVKARTDFGCTTDTMWPCPLTSIVSIIIMILLIGSMVFTFNFVNPKGLLVAGLGILAVFTYVGWFWWVALVLIIIASIFYLRGD